MGALSFYQEKGEASLWGVGAGGTAALHCEESLKGIPPYQAGVEAGADGLNLDLILTADERLVAAHSATHWLPLFDFPTFSRNLRRNVIPRITEPCDSGGGGGGG